jgi:hypothetical protein
VNVNVGVDLKAGHVREVSLLRESICSLEFNAILLVACPTTVGTVNYTQQITTSTNIDNTTYNIPIGRNYGTICSGHGICRTLREVSNGFDGL